MNTKSEVANIIDALDKKHVPFSLDDHLKSITELIDYFRSADLGGRAAILGQMGSEHGARLLSYAMRMAECAV